MANQSNTERTVPVPGVEMAVNSSNGNAATGEAVARALALVYPGTVIERLVGESGGAQSLAAGAEAVAPRIDSIFSVDVEDWFHILAVPGVQHVAEWDQLPSCVERNFTRLLDLFSEKNATVTCFFLGWIAERFPHLVKEAVRRGHEVASHGYSHQLTYKLSREEFYQDILRTRKLLEGIAGAPVLGYRAPSFSTSEWFFDTLVEAGYCYDASVFPARREHGGMLTKVRAPHLMKLRSGSVFEFPMSVHNVLGRPICFSGGGYLRLFPYWLIRRMSRQVLQEGQPVVFYIHPREIDPNHPRLRMGARRRFKSYVNLNTTEQKLMRILDEFPVTTFRDYLFRNARFMETVTPARRAGMG